MVAEMQHIRRSLGFLLLAAFCLVLGGCAEPMPPEHVAAIARVQGLGAKVMFSNGGYQINLKKSRILDSDLPELHKIQNLKRLELQDTRITDEGLQEIAKIQTLEFVHLGGTSTTREGRAALQKARPEVDVRQ